VLKRVEKVLGEQPPRRARVHEPFQVDEQGRSAHVERRVGIQFVEFFRLHASSPLTVYDRFDRATHCTAISIPAAREAATPE